MPCKLPRPKSWLVLAAALTVAGCGKSIEAYLDEAKELHQKGDDKGAVLLLKNAIQMNPNNREARMLLGLTHSSRQDYASAEKEWQRALELGAPVDQVTPELAKALLGMGEYQRVLDEIQPAKAMRPVTLAQVHHARGDAYLNLKQPQEAERAYAQSLEAKPGNPGAVLGQAKLALAGGNIQAALTIVDQVLKQNARYFDAWMMKADLLRLLASTPEAMANYLKAAEIEPVNPSPHFSLASIHIAKGDLDRARAEIEAAARSEPQRLGVYYFKALLAFREGKFNEANDFLQRIMRSGTDHLPSLLLAGMVNYSLGSHEHAYSYLGKVLDQAPESVTARKLMAATQLKLKQPGQAMATLKPFVIDRSQDPQVLALAGEAAMALRDYAKASQYFEAASSSDPRNPALRTELARSRMKTGETARAMQDLELAAGLNDGYYQADMLLVLAHMGRKEYDKTLAALANLEKKLPNDATVYNLSGEAHLGRQDIANARYDFEKALAINPVLFPAAAHLAQLDLHDSKPDAARKRFETILARNPKHERAMLAMASLALKAGKEQEYTYWLEKAADANPGAISPRTLLSQYWLRRNNTSKALVYAREAVNSHPDSPQALELQGQLQLAAGDKANALDTYRKLAELAPDSTLALLNLANAQLLVGQSLSARESLEQALKLDPRSIDAKVALAWLEIRVKHFDRAAGLAREIQTERPTLNLGHVIEGDALLARGNPLQAARLYETGYKMARSGPLAIKLHRALTASGQSTAGEAKLAEWLNDNPGDLVTRLYLAQSLMKRKNYPGAVLQCEAMLKLDPNNLPALGCLAWLYHRDRDPRALQMADTAYRLRPGNPAILDTYGWILAQRGDFKRGLDLLRKAQSKSHDAPEIHWHLAYALHQSGDQAGARQELQRLLASGLAFPQEADARKLLQQLGGWR